MSKMILLLFTILVLICIKAKAQDGGIFEVKK